MNGLHFLSTEKVFQNEILLITRGFPNYFTCAPWRLNALSPLRITT